MHLKIHSLHATVNFFADHSFLPHDSESALKVQEIVCNLNDYITVMQKARKNNPLKSDTMLQQDYSETSEMQKVTMNRKKNTSHSKCNLFKLQQIRITNKPYSIFRDTEFDENFAEVKIKKRSSGLPVSFIVSLTPFSLTGKQMSQPNLNNIKSIMQLTPGDAQHSFTNRAADLNIQGDTDSFDGALNFSKENVLRPVTERRRKRLKMSTG